MRQRFRLMRDRVGIMRRANRTVAVIERLGGIGAGQVRSRITEELLIGLVAPLQTRCDRYRAGKRTDLPGIGHIVVQDSFLLLELAYVEVGG